MRPAPTITAITLAAAVVVTGSYLAVSTAHPSAAAPTATVPAPPPQPTHPVDPPSPRWTLRPRCWPTAAIPAPSAPSTATTTS